MSAGLPVTGRRSSAAGLGRCSRKLRAQDDDNHSQNNYAAGGLDSYEMTVQSPAQLAEPTSFYVF